MKKWVLCALIVGMLCVLTGCNAEEKEAEKSANKEDKYAYVLEGNITEVIEKDLKILDGYELISIIGFDEKSIENYLKDEVYGEWYKEGENTPIDMDSDSFDGLEYGVYYVIRVCEEGFEEYTYDIIKIYERGNAENVFYMVLSSTYEYKPDDSILSYSFMSMRDAEGERKELYQNIPQQELDALWESWETDYYEGTVDGFDYMVEASSTNNCNYNTYKDILRNPMDYYGVKAHTRGTVTWSGDGAFMLETIGGLIYIVYRGEDTPNVIEGDSCIVFGEFNGTGEYTTTNAYGTTSTHTAVVIYAPYMITDQENGAPYDPRIIELLYGTYDTYENVSIDENTIGIAGSNKRYEYSVTFGNVKVSTGHYWVPITLSYYIPEASLTVTAAGYFNPWDRMLLWNEANSSEFYFGAGNHKWYSQINE